MNYIVKMNYFKERQRARERVAGDRPDREETIYTCADQADWDIRVPDLPTDSTRQLIRPNYSVSDGQSAAGHNVQSDDAGMCNRPSDVKAEYMGKGDS